jgi:cytochrome b6-f complex iron-sulfur subunit
MDRSMERREFVQMTACAALGAGVTGCASIALVPVTSSEGRARLVVRNHPQLATPGGHIRIQPDSLAHHLVVFATEDGGFTVLSPVCTHQQCIVDVAGARLVCPCHGSEYDRSGSVLVGPAERRLARYHANLTPDGELVIDLEAI